MCLDLWLQIFLKPTFIPALLSVRFFKSITLLNVPAIETKHSLSGFNQLGGGVSFSGLKQNPKVGHTQQTTETSGTQIASSSTGFYSHGHKMAAGVPAILSTFQTERMGMARG